MALQEFPLLSDSFVLGIGWKTRILDFGVKSLGNGIVNRLGKLLKLVKVKDFQNTLEGYSDEFLCNVFLVFKFKVAFCLVKSVLCVRIFIYKEGDSSTFFIEDYLEN